MPWQDGAVHLHDMAGPDGAPLWLIERSVRAGPANGAGSAHGTDAGRWRLLLAANPRELSQAVGRFAQMPVAPVVDGLLRLMGRVHAERGLDLAQAGINAQLAFAGEQPDLQEMLGNLLDNACQWARHQVRLAVAREGAAGAAQLIFTLDDDGPGIAEDRREAVLARGQRLDESVPGSGLGLAIVDELAALYGGRLQPAAVAAGRPAGGAGLAGAGLSAGPTPQKRHHPIGQLAKAQRQQVQHLVLVQLPGLAITLLGQHGGGALHIA